MVGKYLWASARPQCAELHSRVGCSSAAWLRPKNLPVLILAYIPFFPKWFFFLVFLQVLRFSNFQLCGRGRWTDETLVTYPDEEWGLMEGNRGR